MKLSFGIICKYSRMTGSEENKKNKFFRFPLNFKKSLLLALLFFIAGFALEWLDLWKNISAPPWPYNAYILIFFWLIVILTTLNIESPFVEWLSAKEAAISFMILFFLVVLIGGFFNQDPFYVNGFLKTTGFSHIFHSWYFLISTSCLLIVNGFVIVKKMMSFNLKNNSVGIMLGGFWIIVAVSLLGSSDLYRLSMTLYKSEKNNYSFDKNNHSYKMPFSVELMEFKLKEYTPTLSIVKIKDNINSIEATGKSKELEYLSTFVLDGYKINVLKYFPLSSKIFNNGYKPDTSFGALPSAFISVKNIRSNETWKGWISSGNALYPREILKLDSHFSVVMNYPRPKKISSIIQVYLKDSTTVFLNVNSTIPCKVGKWKLYQSGYDVTMGRWSEYSVVEAVLDPWQKIVYAGIFIFIAGMILQIFVEKGKNVKNL